MESDKTEINHCIVERTKIKQLLNPGPNLIWENSKRIHCWGKYF